jgi:alanyl-tRNA synthetase
VSVPPAELPEAIARLQADGKALRRRAGELQIALAGQEAERLLALASQTEPAPIVAAVMDGWEAGALRAVASSLIARGPLQVVLTTSDSPVSIVVAQSAASGAAAADVVARLTARFGGRGGGNRQLAQAGGLTESAQVVVDAARELLV